MNRLKIVLSIALSVSSLVFPAGEYYRCPGQPLKYEWLALAEKNCDEPQLCYTELRERQEIYDTDPYDRSLIGHPTLERVEICGSVYVFPYEKMLRIHNKALPDINNELAPLTGMQENPAEDYGI